MRWRWEVALHPGRPHRSVVVAALERLVAHRHPAIVLRRIEETGGQVPADRPAEAIAEAWEAAGAPSAFEVEAAGGGTLVITTQDLSIGLLGSLSLHWALDRALDDGLVDLAADLSGTLSSPLAVLSHTSADWRVRAGWQSRRALHRDAARAAVRPQRVFYGLYLGLAGVAHRMVLGDELVAMFGEDRLAALPPELAHRRNGRWVLTPTGDPLEWTHDRWCPGESAIIEALGREHFFDPSTGALPTVVPDLPRVAPYRCRTRDPATGTWTEHNA